MSKDSSYKETLIRYRLDEAKAALQDAQMLYEQNGTPRSDVNRAYYAMFDREFVKKNVFSKEMSTVLYHAFDIRLTGDYRELLEISKEQAAEILHSASKFVRSIEEQLSKKP